MQELETLLNTLIQQGWKPFGKKYTHLNYDPKRKHRHIMFGGVDLAVFSYSLRQLVSLESGLWQFCEKNGLLHEYYNGRSNIHPYKCYWTTTYEYRLLESALIPEEELAQFLVENIKNRIRNQIYFYFLILEKGNSK